MLRKKHQKAKNKRERDSYYYCDLCLDIVVSRWTLQGKMIQDIQSQARLKGGKEKKSDGKSSAFLNNEKVIIMQEGTDRKSAVRCEKEK